jgi:hypothetical protein
MKDMLKSFAPIIWLFALIFVGCGERSYLDSDTYINSFSGNIGSCYHFSAPTHDSHLSCIESSYSTWGAHDPGPNLISNFKSDCLANNGNHYHNLKCDRQRIHGHCEIKGKSGTKQNSFYTLRNNWPGANYSYAEIKTAMDEKNRECLANGGIFSYNLPKPEPTPQPRARPNHQPTPRPAPRPQPDEYTSPPLNNFNIQARFQVAKSNLCNLIDITDARSATHAEIKSAYRRKSLKVHPDRNSSANATEEFQALGNLNDRYNELYQQYQSNW